MTSSSDMTLDELRDILLACAGAEEGVDLSGAIAGVDFDDLGYDSLALLEMASMIEQIRGIKIPDDAFTELRTPAAVLELVNSGSAAAPAPAAAGAAADR
jgi:act minimal PKS acyl carrier protein